MIVTLSEHDKGGLESLALLHPDKVIEVISESSRKAELVPLQIEVVRWMVEFDQRPFTIDCDGEGCTNRANRFSVHGEDLEPHYWCRGCVPYDLEPSPVRLETIATYEDALWSSSLNPLGKPEVRKRLIRTLAEAKGISIGECEDAGG